METNSSMLVSVVIMVGVMMALVLDLLRARHARARLAAMPRPGTALAPERRMALPPMPVVASVPPAVAAVQIRSVARPLPPMEPDPMEPDPIRELAERLATLRLLGLDHVKSAHPLLRAPAAMASAAASKPAAMPAFVLAATEPTAPVRRRRPRRPPYGAPRAAAPLRLVVDRA